MSVSEWLTRSLGSGSGKNRGEGLDGLSSASTKAEAFSSGAANTSWKATDNVGRLLGELQRPGVLERRKDGERYLLQYIDAVRTCVRAYVRVRAGPGAMCLCQHVL
jgi:hypothetical protein